MQGKIALYLLFDPRTQQLKYVGATESPKIRFKQHCEARQHANRNLLEWLQDLRANGREPSMEIVSVVNRADAFQAEVDLIECCRIGNPGLLNADDTKGYLHRAETPEPSSDHVLGHSW